LQEALKSANEAREQLKKRVKELDEDLTTVHKELKETEARWRALLDRNELLDQEKVQLSKSNKDLHDENAQLREELEELRGLREHKDQQKEVKRSRRKSMSGGSPPVMSGALPAVESTEDKVRRSSSKRHSIKDTDKKEREREKREREKLELMEKEKETERLRKRFDTRSDDSDTKSNSTTGKTHRTTIVGRRESYVEPLGHPAPRPQVVVPPSPSTRQPYPAYAPPSSYSQYAPPSSRELATRPARPTVYLTDDRSIEDDGYFTHQKRDHRR